MAVSEFQLALIGAGLVAVVGVWGYNIWQEQRQRKTAEKIFRETREDALIVESPPIGGEAPRRGVAPVQSRERVEPVFEQSHRDDRLAEDDAAEPLVDVELIEPKAVLAEAATDGAPPESLLDAMIEVGVALPPDQDVGTMQAAWRAADKIDFRKRIRWVGRTGTTGEWIEIGEGTATTADHARVAIQLADRQGVVSLEELRGFCQTAEAIALDHGAAVDLPALDEIFAHARALDDLCASVDIQIAMHMVSRSGQAFAGSKLRGMLEAAGLQLAADGRFYLADAEGRQLLSVCNSGAVPFDVEQMRTGNIADVTFWLDVPRVGNGGNVFDTMLATARQLAGALDGVLVDDKRNPLADSVLAGIRAKVVELQGQMTAHGIPAGGRRALRLFA